MIDLQIEEKVVLITGANHGIGATAARAFAAQGAKVFLIPTCIHNDLNIQSQPAIDRRMAGLSSIRLSPRAA